MAPAYKAPGPISIASNYGAGVRGGGGGGGSGGVIYIPDRTGDYANRLDAIGLQGQIEGDLSNQRFVQAGMLAQQHAELNAWQYQQQVTTQEQAQLRQDQNSIAAIDADPTMTPLEKMQAKLRIKTRIDWVSERQKRDLQQAQVEQAQAHAKMYQMQAGLDEQRLQASAAIAQNKIKTIVDPSRVPELESLVRDAGYDPKSPDGIQMMDKIGHEKGYTQTFAINDKGIITGKPLFVGSNVLSPDGGGAGSSGARSSTKAGLGEEDVRAATHIVDRASEGARKAKQADPSIDEEAEYQKLYKRYRGELDAISPAKKKEVAMAQHQEVLTGIDARKQQLMDDGEVDPRVKANGIAMLDEMKKLRAKYPPGESHPIIEKKLEQLKGMYELFLQATHKSNRDSRGVAAPGAAAGTPVNPATIGVNPNEAGFGVVSDAASAVKQGAKRLGGAVSDLFSMLSSGG